MQGQKQLMAGPVGIQRSPLAGQHIQRAEELVGLWGSLGRLLAGQVGQHQMVIIIEAVGPVGMERHLPGLAAAGQLPGQATGQGRLVMPVVCRQPAGMWQHTGVLAGLGQQLTQLTGLRQALLKITTAVEVAAGRETVLAGLVGRGIL
jgi:hypothetical protein